MHDPRSGGTVQSKLTGVSLQQLHHSHDQTTTPGGVAIDPRLGAVDKGTSSL